jgi:hypothetical protein
VGIQVSPENVVGRNRLIDQIWRKLRKHSIRFTAERRVGKTTVMRKMLAECRPGTELVFVDLEKVDSPHRFTEVLLTEMKPWLSRTQNAAGWLQGFLTEIHGVEIAGVIKIPDGNRIGWKAMLEKTFARVCSQHPDTLLVLLLDELPYMLQKIAAKRKTRGDARTCGPRNPRHLAGHASTARELAHDLRRIRRPASRVDRLEGNTACQSTSQRHALGSDRGLEHVGRRHVGQTPAEGRRRSVVEADEERFPGELASLTDRVPFYLERVVARLAELDGPVSVEHAHQVVRQQMTDDHDAWEMEHFRTRLEIYYPGTSTDANGRSITNESVARALLDILAVTSTPQTIDQVWAAMKAQMALDDRHEIVRLLTSLAQDHYLIADTEKRYSFRFPLIRRWWILAQGLS